MITFTDANCVIYNLSFVEWKRATQNARIEVGYGKFKFERIHFDEFSFGSSFRNSPRDSVSVRRSKRFLLQDTLGHQEASAKETNPSVSSKRNVFH